MQNRATLRDKGHISALFQIVGIALLVPFFGWAIHLLRRRFVYYEENSIGLEAATAGGLILFYWLEATVLKYALGHQVLLYLFSILGLVVAGFALYAHVVISLVSRVLVDLVVPGESGGVDQPRFGPVESLERSEDFEGALKEYLVLARIYPRNFEVLSRTARVNQLLGQPGEAVAWYMRARKRAPGAREALAAVNHLCALYDGELSLPDETDRQLAWFMATYPDSPDASIVRDRLERRAIKSEVSISSRLSALDADPLDASEALMPEVPGTPLPLVPHADLVTLAAEGAAPPAVQAPPEASRLTPSRISLDSLDEVSVSGADAPLKPDRSNGHRANRPPRTSATPAEARPGTTTSRPHLEALEEAGPAPSPSAAPVPAPKSSLSLEAMDADPSEP